MVLREFSEWVRTIEGTFHMSVISPNICNPAAYAVAEAHNSEQLGCSWNNPYVVTRYTPATSQPLQKVLDDWASRNGGPEAAAAILQSSGLVPHNAWLCVAKKRELVRSEVPVFMERKVLSIWDSITSELGPEVQLGAAVEHVQQGTPGNVTKYSFQRYRLGRTSIGKWVREDIISTVRTISDNREELVCERILQNCLRHSGLRLPSVRFYRSANIGGHNATPLVMVLSATGEAKAVIMPRFA